MYIGSFRDLKLDFVESFLGKLEKLIAKLFIPYREKTKVVSSSLFSMR